MDLLKPDYYDDFSCIADKCTISYCREWKINVDDVTCRKWKAIQQPEDVPGHRSGYDAVLSEKKKPLFLLRRTVLRNCSGTGDILHLLRENRKNHNYIIGSYNKY